MSILIVGAGLAGLSAAQGLARRGITGITILDAEGGPGLGTSFANGALLHPSLAEPWNSPGVAGQLIRDLGNEHAAALVRMRALPGLIGWGLRFIRESSPERYLRHTLANLALARYSLAQMAAIRSLGVRYEHHASGSVVLFRDRRSMAAASAWAHELVGHGLPHEPIGVDEVVEREPALASIAGDLVGAFVNRGDERGDAHAYCESLALHLQARGVTIGYRSPVGRIVIGPGRRVRGVVMASGKEVDCETLIVAAGCHSATLLRGVGMRLPVRPVKGYSVTFEPTPSREANSATFLPRLPVVDPALHVAVVPVGEHALRVAGTAEFCGFDLSLSPARVSNLVRLVARIYPEVVNDTRNWTQRPWTGLRPMSADGVPLIGPTRIEGLFLNTGHGHLGWTQAAGSGELVAAMVNGDAPELDPTAYAPARFGSL